MRIFRLFLVLSPCVAYISWLIGMIFEFLTKTLIKPTQIELYYWPLILIWVAAVTTFLSGLSWLRAITAFQHYQQRLIAKSWRLRLSGVAFADIIFVVLYCSNLMAERRTYDPIYMPIVWYAVYYLLIISVSFQLPDKIGVTIRKPPQV